MVYNSDRVAQLVERGTHNPKVAGSNPAPVTIFNRRYRACWIKTRCSSRLPQQLGGHINESKLPQTSCTTGRQAQIGKSAKQAMNRAIRRTSRHDDFPKKGDRYKHLYLNPWDRCDYKSRSTFKQWMTNAWCSYNHYVQVFEYGFNRWMWCEAGSKYWDPVQQNYVARAQGEWIERYHRSYRKHYEAGPPDEHMEYQKWAKWYRRK